MRQQRTGKGPWVFACVALAPVLALFALKSDGIARGRWNCEICGCTEHRVKIFGVTCSSEPRACGSPDYAAWWAREIHAEHAHYWTPIGCHWSGNTVGCTMRYEPLLTHLGDPTAPTPEFRAAATALARANGDERGELIVALIDSVLRSPPEGEERVHDVTSLRARSPDWDRAIAAVEIPPAR